MVQLLLERGFNPNGLYLEGIVWTFFLEHERTHLMNGKPIDFDVDYRITRGLFEHGADVNAICTVEGDKRRAADVIKILLYKEHVVALEDLLASKSVNLVNIKPKRHQRFVNAIFGGNRGRRKT